MRAYTLTIVNAQPTSRVESGLYSNKALVAPGIASALESRFGFPIPVALQTFGEFAAAIAANPFVAQGANVDQLHIVFFETEPSPAIVQALGGKCVGEEKVESYGRQLFLFLPHGVGRSKLALACTVPSMPRNALMQSTMRRWKTVLQLQTMLSAPA